MVAFFETLPLNETSLRLVQGATGLYFIFLEGLWIPYPSKPSRLIYIGMSESKQNSIGNRLRDHRSGQSGNPAIVNYVKTHKVRFTHLADEFLAALGDWTVQQLESSFLQDFLLRHGSYPICNNQSGVVLPEPSSGRSTFSVDWTFFE